jgi:hypothetical protein
MIHLEAKHLAERRGALTDSDIAVAADALMVELGAKNPGRSLRDPSGRGIRAALERVESEGDDTVTDLVGRLVAEVLETVPSELGANPPELPYARQELKGVTFDDLRALQRKRLAKIVAEMTERRVLREARKQVQAEGMARTMRRRRERREGGEGVAA